MPSEWRWIVEPGFWSSAPVHTALLTGGAAAAVSAVAGVFTVLRGQSFAGHALTDVSAAGGSASVLVGVAPLLGFTSAGLIGGVAMDLLGTGNRRGRDLATGVVLGAFTGLAALILYFDSTSRARSGVTQQILFGSLFAVDPSTLPLVGGLSIVALGLLATFYRPLLLTSLGAELSVGRGVHGRRVGLAFMAALAVAVGLSALTVGAVLSTALLVGPAAAAVRWSTRVGRSMWLAAAFGVGCTWVGVLLAYDSYYWIPGGRGLPVSFLVVGLVLAGYLASARRGTRGTPREGVPEHAATPFRAGG